MNRELHKKIYSPRIYRKIEFIVLLCTLEIIISFVISTYNPPYEALLFKLDFFSISFLTFEFIYRFVGSKNKTKFFKDKYNLIDAFVIVAFIMYLLEATLTHVIVSLRIINAVRVLMVLRAIKFKELRLSNETINFITIFTFSFILSCFIWLVEHEVNPGINNFGDAFYFTVVSLTTIGYGDITPMTSEGKLIIVLAVLYVISGLVSKAKGFLHEEHRLYYENKKIKKKIS
ncbi:Ion transport 2 domain protein [Methanococcus aeolicus Nankai-3]|uniref:Ion transport 2 domain protein n=1 Tax=Methanococcus aeolicus (strain ATCC BAA-1280 / DSM 17508 / OCM 812 / Nankai-3) TaxID=419665 RepID=A6UX53_META3|nr:hyperpolarization-activated voltage-gated potassium channel [Methanococcus aeolicus]ABR57075.1 Ion transport 2 domain protein [Methanococcus aeolicus Nankai-3]